MLQPPRVSVVVPCFNHGSFLPQAVASALAQSLAELEVILVDDGSTDDSAAVADRLAAASAGRARVLRKQNGGLPSARNAGIAVARGEYVLPLDADDALTPDFAERLAAALDARPDVAIAYGDQQNFGEDATFHSHPEYDFRTLTRKNLIGVASLFRRSAWEDVGGYAPLDSYEDWDFWIACGERGHVGLHVPGAVFCYRVRSGSMFDEATRRDQRLKAQIVLNHPRLYATAEVEWAAAVLGREPWALAIDGPLCVMPELGGAGPWWTGERLSGTRERTVLVPARELLASPGLRAALGRGRDGLADATVLVAGGATSDGAAVPGLEEAVAGLGDLDLLATALPDAVLAQHADAILTLESPPPVFGGLPRVDPETLTTAAFREAVAA